MKNETYKYYVQAIFIISFVAFYYLVLCFIFINCFFISASPIGED